MKPKKSLTYRETGVNYSVLDPIKVMAQTEGRKTSLNLDLSGMKEVSQSRGESAYVVEYFDCYFAIVEECLGTKSLVADATSSITGKSYYDSIAQDTVACIVNDLITVGAQPSAIAAYWAVGSQDWFANTKRAQDLISGWAKACDAAGCAWGGGETPTVKDIVGKDAIDLAGSCFGIIKPKTRLTFGEKLTAGDAIILLESRGIQANGVSLARSIADNLSEGYKTKLPDGTIYGEALLEPTILYSRLIQDIFASGINIHYMANITGHGWRKIMRSEKELTYRISEMPKLPEVFTFMMEKGPIEQEEAYASFNMGAGFAVFVSKQDVEKVLQICTKNGIRGINAGVVEEGKKQVIIEPLGITFDGSSLSVKAV